MKATGLSVGNWVNRYYGDPTNISAKPQQFTTADFNYLAFFEPIPLTEEILLRAGLTRDEVWDEGYLEYILYKFDEKEIYIEGGCAIKYYDNKYYFSVSGELCYGLIGEKLEYFHTVQNLYFALTGKELKTKE